MAVKLMAILLVETALFVITGHVVLATDSNSKHERPQKVTTTIRDNFRRANGVIKSIQSEDGDIIDCIDIYKQPALSHPALKNHKIQMEPSYVPTTDQTTRKINRAKGKKNKPSKSEVPLSVIKQIWHKNGSCPEGTVPIRRNLKTNNKAVPIVSRRYQRSFSQLSQNNTSNLLRPNHALSVLMTDGDPYFGAQGGIAVYNPEIEKSDEYSLSDISLETGGPESFETVRSGWMVNPAVYGDKMSRFFTYWTSDGGHETGCFDHICPGFIQVSKNIALGAIIDHISTPPNKPAELLSISIYKDMYTDNWWVDSGGEKIGYWPANLFEELNHNAEAVQWGGDVYSTRLETHPHTATGMGSGGYSSPIDWLSGSIRGIRILRILQNSLVWIYPDWAAPYADQVNCYDYNLQVVSDDPVFYYGGPGSGGQASKCP
ncbi:OLC1v1029166C1 [Oldenlandia corymbosa var. corymbosa]|uniref:OLC1v1029166C1 n=1 Tax=Oldenlandia corymbosa var. corymbosa TaxID=529605 RepID=A0AAV1CDC9_OLDCO|nr:OLC1v1029166C1 [Oldenlandia corymbosa var. corymbosa]